MNTDIEQRVTTVVTAVLTLKSSIYPTIALSISYLTLFAQSEQDYNELIERLSHFGSATEANNGYKFALTAPISILGETIPLIRVRKPDIHRHEVGCADFSYKESDYPQLRNIALSKGLDIIVRKGYEMIELSTFDINAYAYLVKDTP